MTMYSRCWVSDEYKRDADGYVRMRYEGVITRAHRVSFFLWHGYWPNICRHTCDNPPCYNPTHLLDGTRADNNRDKRVRGRALGIGGSPMLNLGMPDYRSQPTEYAREVRARKRAGTWVYRV